MAAVLARSEDGAGLMQIGRPHVTPRGVVGVTGLSRTDVRSGHRTAARTCHLPSHLARVACGMGKVTCGSCPWAWRSLFPLRAVAPPTSCCVPRTLSSTQLHALPTDTAATPRARRGTGIRLSLSRWGGRSASMSFATRLGRCPARRRKTCRRRGGGRRP